MPPPPVTPTHIGRYTIQGELGRGGMAAVYRAYDPSFKREVAIKVLPREFLHDTTFRARFEREAQTIARLEHSAIVPVYDYGEEDGQPYLVMRLMAGGSLADRIDRGPLSLPETVNLLSRLAPALDRAHALGIVHRDLKPANILFDADGDPYISDFGIAKLTQANTQLSQTGVMGTPAYMSPEQARGDKQIDGRADLYALGAMVYHMLSGQRPFESDTPMGMVLKHVTEPPPRIGDIRPELPAALDAVITKAMAKDPSQRFATAAELVAALRSAQTAPPRPIPDPTNRAAPRTVLVDPASVDQAPLVPAAPARSFPLLLVGLGGLAVLALAAVGVFIFTAISLYGPRAATATPRAQRSPTVPVVVAPTGRPSNTPAPSVTLAGSSVAAATGVGAATEPLATDTPAATQSPAPAGSATPLPGATRASSIDKMVQVYVPAGPFTMGNDQGKPDQRPAHTVNLDAFWIDRTEVTNDMYGACVRAAICAPPQQLRSISRLNYFGSTSFTNFPVLFVSWTQAQTYCQWAGRRLPTEAEWEKAARGTDGRLYPWGNQPPDPQRLNFGPSGLGDTVAVGLHPTNASPYGALDMAGNAWEWVADWYDPGYYAVSPADNPPGPAKTGCPQGDCKVLRGGGWDSNAQDVMATARLFYGPNDTRDAFTIRCAQP